MGSAGLTTSWVPASTVMATPRPRLMIRATRASYSSRWSEYWNISEVSSIPIDDRVQVQAPSRGQGVGGAR